MGRKYCCVPGCHNTSISTGLKGEKIILHRFPMSEKKAHIKRLWIQHLRNVRANQIVKDHTHCSAHFDGPFTEDSIPTIFPSKPKTDPTPRRPPIRKPLTTSSIENLSASCALEDEVDDEPEMRFKDICVQTDIVEVRNIETNTVDWCFQETQSDYSSSSGIMSSLDVQADLPRITVEDIERNDEKVRFYTGYANFQVFWLFFTTLLKHGADRLNYWEGEARSMGDKPYQQPGVGKPGRKHFLRPLDEFLMMCMRLRLGLLQEHLADIFRVSETTVSRIMNTWINFVYDHCLSLVAWPTREEIMCNMPRLFSVYADARIVIDCTEFHIEKPSALTAQWLTWSEYKHSNTFKVLIGVAPNGTVTFVSRLWGGNASDRHITQHDGFLPKLSPDHVVMADKGFTIEDLLPSDTGLNVPPRVSSQHQMSCSEFYKTQSIASARIVVEMKMEQLKNYHIINTVLPISEAHLAEQMVFICAALTNLLPPLLK